MQNYMYSTYNFIWYMSLYYDIFKRNVFYSELYVQYI